VKQEDEFKDCFFRYFPPVEGSYYVQFGDLCRAISGASNQFIASLDFLNIGPVYFKDS